MAPNDTTTGNSRYDVPDKQTRDGEDVTEDAAGHYYKTSGGEVNPSDLENKSPPPPPPSTDSWSSSSDPSHFSGDSGGNYGDSGSGDGDGGGILQSILDSFSS